MTAGAQGHAETAKELVERYESIRFIDKHRAVMHLIPQGPSRILDIGAGSGADAAWLSDRGHTVMAVEPTRELRIAAMELHSSPLIEWLDDSLPDLTATRQMARVFDLVMMTAVWMHLDRQERRTAMPNLASLLRTDGVLLLSLRHGPAPSGRRMFDVPADETVELARAHGLREMLQMRMRSVQAANRQAGVAWTQLAFLRTY